MSSMEEVYEELAQSLYAKVQHLDMSNPDDHPPAQYWVAIVGGAGSGKTTVANAVAERLNRSSRDIVAAASSTSRPIAVVIPMDGFHYSQEKLKELFGGEHALLRRGAPHTFDADYLVQALTLAKREHQATLPAYDRSISDPVENKVHLCQHHSVVLVEGLYLLHARDKRYAPLQTLWDERWFVKAPSVEVQKQRLVDRSLTTWSDLKAKQWGPGKLGATKRVEENDMLNLKLIEYCKDLADRVIVTRPTFGSIANT